MEPVAISTAVLAALYIFGRGPLVFAPEATLAAYRRLLSSLRRVRIFGGLLVLIAVPLIVTARQARPVEGGITYLIEGLGWLAAAAACLLVAAPALFQRLMHSFWDAVGDPPMLRTIGVLNIAGGLWLAWIAFFVLGATGAGASRTRAVAGSVLSLRPADQPCRPGSSSPSR